MSATRREIKSMMRNVSQGRAYGMDGVSPRLFHLEKERMYDD